MHESHTAWDLVRAAGMTALDEGSGGSVSARFLQDASEAIPAMAEFPRGIPAAEFLRGIGGRLLTRITYHLGQFGLAVGVVLVLLVR